MHRVRATLAEVAAVGDFVIPLCAPYVGIITSRTKDQPMAHTLLERQILYDGKKVRLEIHHLEDGDGTRYKIEVCAHLGAVVILPMLDEKTVLLIRNFRQTVGQYLIELPAGTLNRGEAPINAAGRELLEETGYLARRIKPIMSFYASPGILTEKLHAFAAYDLELKSAAPEIGEDIELRPMPLESAIEAIHNGEIVDAKTIVTLMAYHRWGTLKSAALEAGVK
jgi:ADP-ribose pyrophosphatase